ncbi:MAG: hypothetical protein GC162_13885 [Planctomycetes bacterium]|nr:hypothetical protein [Planctomycetota bacterium]
MIHDVYQIFRDLYEGAEKRRIVALSSEQIDLTIGHIDAICDTQIKQIELEGELAKRANYRDHVNSAALQNASRRYPNVFVLGGGDHTTIDELTAVRIGQARTDAAYVKKILELEKSKRTAQTVPITTNRN